MLRALGPASALAVWTAVIPILGTIVLVWQMEPLGAWLRAQELFGVAVFTAAFACAVGLALVPTYLSSILAGWSFGFALGFPAALVGFTAGAALGYGVARLVAHDRVERVLAVKPEWIGVRNALLRSGFWKSFLIVLLVRLPTSPFAFTNIALAALRVPLGAYVLGTFIGMAPRTAAVIWLTAAVRGEYAHLKDARAAQDKFFDSGWAFAISVGGMIAAVLIISAIAKRALRQLTAAPVGTDVPPQAAAGA